jgi:hypothetical protein
MDLVEPAGADHELQWQQNENGKDIEGRLIGKDSIGLDTFESQNSLTELHLGHSIRGYVAERVRQHRHENGQEESVAQECKGDHKARPKELVELRLYPSVLAVVGQIMDDLQTVGYLYRPVQTRYISSIPKLS